MDVYFGFSLQRCLLTKNVCVFLKWTSAFIRIAYYVPVKNSILFFLSLSLSTVTLHDDIFSTSLKLLISAFWYSPQNFSQTIINWFNRAKLCENIDNLDTFNGTESCSRYKLFVFISIFIFFYSSLMLNHHSLRKYNWKICNIIRLIILQRDLNKMAFCLSYIHHFSLPPRTKDKKETHESK